MRALTTLTFTTLSLAQLTHSSQPPPPSQCGLGTPPTPLQHKSLTRCLDSTIPLPRPPAWSPWTHQPHCVPAADEPWCVYTSAASPRGHGLSVITTPDQASTLLNPVERRFDAPFFAPAKLASPPPYEVRDVPGKGKGAVATRPIEKGRALLVDHASVVAAVEYPADVMREEVRELIRVAVERLSEPEKVMGLARKGRSKGGEGKEEEEGEEEEAGDGETGELEEVILTNTFGVGIGGKEYMALFADLAVSFVFLLLVTSSLPLGGREANDCERGSTMPASQSESVRFPMVMTENVADCSVPSSTSLKRRWL